MRRILQMIIRQRVEANNKVLAGQQLIRQLPRPVDHELEHSLLEALDVMYSSINYVDHFTLEVDLLKMRVDVTEVM